MRNDELIRFRLPGDLKDEVFRQCAMNGVSVGAYMRALIRENMTVPRSRRRTHRHLTLTDGTTLRR